jgi:hypothetical protein
VVVSPSHVRWAGPSNALVITSTIRAAPHRAVARVAASPWPHAQTRSIALCLPRSSFAIENELPEWLAIDRE